MIEKNEHTRDRGRKREEEGDAKEAERGLGNPFEAYGNWRAKQIARNLERHLPCPFNTLVNCICFSPPKAAALKVSSWQAAVAAVAAAAAATTTDRHEIDQDATPSWWGHRLLVPGESKAEVPAIISTGAPADPLRRSNHSPAFALSTFPGVWMEPRGALGAPSGHAPESVEPRTWPKESTHNWAVVVWLPW
ncbi:hypothetical protein PG993_012700 [Apiospora rasikravindrae]|uniref:Uncharacterized protein n=1 Tax=Apiospora rasikravindrae TaxID=990691 RepID=A0ABR1S5F8_9PEZI